MKSKKNKAKKNRATKKSNSTSNQSKAAKIQQGLQLSDSTEFVLEEFEQQVYSGNYCSAANYLLRLLRTFESFTLLPKEGESIVEFSTRKKRWSSRLAGACSALFVSPKWQISDSLYYFLSRFHDWLSKIYELSIVQNGNYVLDLINSTSYPSEEQKFKRFFLHISLNSPQEIYQILLSDKDLSLPIVLSMVGDSCTLDQEQQEKRGMLIQNFNALTEGANLYDDFAGCIHKPWMFCSYAVDDHRHLVKMGINKLISELFSVIKPSKPQAKNSGKPKLAVLIEVCREDHAMYRCYGPLLKSLKQQFNVTFIATKDSIDDTVSQLADDCIYIDYTTTSMQKIAELIQKQNFEMIYYPSIGMSTWTIIMSNLRLAAVQCYSLGHPATSCSSEIDFALCDQDTLSDPLCFTEKILLSKGSGAFAPHPNKMVTKVEKGQDGIVRIAIVSKFMKLNSLLLSLCKELVEKSQSKIEFHIFADTSGLLLDYLKHAIFQQIPNSVVYPTLGYDDYMKLMSHCDIRLGTFPFGGTNTTVDCLLLGIPVLTLDGAEIFNHADSVLINRYCPQLSKYLVADNIEQLVDKSIALIDDISLRQEVVTQIEAIDFEKSIFYRDGDHDAGISVDSLLWALKNIQSIRQSDEQVIEI